MTFNKKKEHKKSKLKSTLTATVPGKKMIANKAKLLLLKLIHLFAREVLLVKKLKIEETKTTYYSTFKTDIIKVGLVFSISNFFTNKIYHANKWMSF